MPHPELIGAYDPSSRYPRPTDEPGGEKCGFCGKENDFWDDCGFFYVWPDPKIEEGRAACKSCYQGEPGQKHVKRYGVGER